MNFSRFQVLLDIGREGRYFTYRDGNQLGVEVGDLVEVRLRGKRMRGLVVQRTDGNPLEDSENPNLFQELKESSLKDIDDVIQKSVVSLEWYSWIDSMAIRYHVSSFRMLKTAFPSSWLGHRKTYKAEIRSLWWINLTKGSSSHLEMSRRQKELEQVISSSGGGAWQKDLNAEGFSTSLLNKFIASGFAVREKRLLNKEQLTEKKDHLINFQVYRELTDEQKSALKCYESLPSGSALLLWGVTGSGKTEIYLQAAAKELQAGRHCLVLTPEIALIPQLIDRFRERFGSRVLEYHSNCSEKQRVETWRNVLHSSIPSVLIGTRSAIFLPLNPLGLIVLDEEHDASYKQEAPMPCYHAKDLALERGISTGAKVILGSATPSLSTWRNLAPNGDIYLSKLNRRIFDQVLPKVHVVDMRLELAQGHKRLISRPLMNRLSRLREDEEQAVLLVPRRGYSNFISCRSCGEVVECPHCDVPLTLHRNNHGIKWLRCHWCDYRSEIQNKCSECGSFAFKPFGAGTQRVMEYLSNELEGIRFLRFDRDSTGGRDGHRKLLEDFALGKADVLVGTQMLSKGMDLPRVTLAAVLAADGLLHRPDLFSGEQTLQLFMQLAGRAGRGDKAGDVLVQTYCPGHPVISHLVDGSYEAFLKEESRLRKEAGLVPYRRACLLRFAGHCASSTEKAAISISQKISDSCHSKGWDVVGPAPSLVPKVAGKSRWQLLLHGPESSSLPLPYGKDLWEWLPQGVTLSVDPDPMEL